MKAFSSIRREFKALYKPRPAGISGKAEDSPVELEGTSRPGSASSNRTSECGLAESDYLTSHIHAALSPHHSTREDEDKAQTEPGTLPSPPESHVDEGRGEMNQTTEVALPDSPASGEQDESSELHEAAEGPSLTFEEAQAIRSARYICFEGDDEGDFTQGLARFVIASDGIQDCGALLMTPQLCTQIQEAVHKQHEFKHAELAGLRQRQALMRFEYRVESEIANCRSKIAAARDVDIEKEVAAQNQLDILSALLENVQSRRQVVKVNLGCQADDLRNVQAAAIALIEEAFVRARLIAEDDEPPSPKVDELDLETEYAAFCEKLNNADDDDGMVPAAPPLDTSRDREDEIPVLTEEEQANQNIINDLWASKEALDQARRDFEEREILRAQEYQANAAAFDRGEPTTDDSPEAFDVRWVKRYGELTRALIEAEAAYADVKRTAFEAEIPLPFMDNETIFEGMATDGVGYTVSKEQELVDSVPSPTVRQWLSRVPEDISVGSPADQPESEVGEWEAEEVGISDSVSLVAEGKERARIDRWRKACDAEKRQ